MPPHSRVDARSGRSIAPRTPRCALAWLLAIVVCSASAPVAAWPKDKKKDKKSKPPVVVSTATPIEFTPFGEKNDGVPYNTSSILPVSDGVFLLVDNKIHDAMLELRLDEDGVKNEPLLRRPLAGVAPGIVSDLEATTWVDGEERPFIVATSSFNRKHGYDSKGQMIPIEGFADGLLRIRRSADGALTAEHVPDFRQWLVAAYADLLGPVADKVPDDGGLNIEGLEWDRKRRALLFGLRSPLRNGRPVVLPVRIKNVDGPWALDQFEALPPVAVPIEMSEVGWGIRGIGRPESGRGFLVTVGKSSQGRRVPFQLYLWDGEDSALRFSDVIVTHGNKPEGVCVGTVGGRVAGLLADDAGGYAVIFDDDPRIVAITGQTEPKRKRRR